MDETPSRNGETSDFISVTYPTFLAVLSGRNNRATCARLEKCMGFGRARMEA